MRIALISNAYTEGEKLIRFPGESTGNLVILINKVKNKNRSYLDLYTNKAHLRHKNSFPTQKNVPTTTKRKCMNKQTVFFLRPSFTIENDVID